MIEVTSATFESEVLNAAGLVFVDYYGDNCIPCQALQPRIEELEKQYGDVVKFTAVNASKEFRLAVKQKILGSPSLVFYRDGKAVRSLLAGNATAENLEAALREQTGR